MSLLSKQNPVKTLVKHSGLWISDFNDFTAFFGYFGCFNDTLYFREFHHSTLKCLSFKFFCVFRKTSLSSCITTNIFLNHSVWNAKIQFEGSFWFWNLLEVFWGLKENSRPCILNNSFLIGKFILIVLSP